MWVLITGKIYPYHPPMSTATRDWSFGGKLSILSPLQTWSVGLLHMYQKPHKYNCFKFVAIIVIVVTHDLCITQQRAINTIRISMSE